MVLHRSECAAEVEDSLMRSPQLRGMTRRQRESRIDALILQHEAWELQGRGILAALLELTEPGDPLAVECRLQLDLLDG